MSQVTEYVVSGSPLTMAALAAELEAMFAAAASANRGATAPDNSFEGMFWWDTSGTPTETLKRYTVAAGWVSLLSVNSTTGAATIQSLTLTAAATGFTIAGGVTSKTLTVDHDFTTPDQALDTDDEVEFGSVIVKYMADKVSTHGTEPTAADDDAVATAQTPGGTGNLTLTSSPYTPAIPRKITITSDGDESGVTFTVTYKDEDGNSQTSDAMTGPDVTTITVQKSGTNIWATEVSQIAISGAGTGNITAGIGDGLVTFDLAEGGVHTITPATDFTYRFDNWPSSGYEWSLQVVITDGGAVTITDPDGVAWPEGIQPTLTASGRDRLIYVTDDGGTVIDGTIAMKGIS